MATHAEITHEPPGAPLNRMLSGYRTFLENVYSLMRFLETQVVPSGWVLVKLGGAYAVTRNSLGSGLASFAKADWVTNHAGIAFVRPGSSGAGTRIPADGLDVLLFQVRWLDKAPHEPVVWYARLRVKRSKPDDDAAWSATKWEDYQTEVFRRLESDGPPDGARSGTIKPGTVAKGGAEILFTGQYTEVPVTSLLSQEDVVSLLVEPALANSREGV